MVTSSLVNIKLHTDRFSDLKNCYTQGIMPEHTS